MAIGTPYSLGTADNYAASTTLVLTVGANSNAGDAIIVGASVNSVAETVSSVTDSKGNTYAKAVTQSAGYDGAMFVALGTTALVSGTDTITVTFSSASAIAKNMAAWGVSGVYAAAALDQTVTAENAGSTSPSATTGALAQPNEMVFAWLDYGSGGGTIAWTSGWTQLIAPFEYLSNQQSSVAYQQVNATSAVTASGTITSAKWALMALSLKGNASPPATFATGSATLSTPSVTAFASAASATATAAQPTVSTVASRTATPSAAGATATAPAPSTTTGGIGSPYGLGSVDNNAASTTVVLTVAATSVAGDCIIVGASVNSTAEHPSSVSDSAGNTYTKIVSQNTPYGQALFAAYNTSPLVNGTGTITVTFSSAGGQAKNVGAMGCSGVAHVGAVDQAVDATGTSATPSVTTAGLAASNELVVAWVDYANAGGSSIAWGGGFQPIIAPFEYLSNQYSAMGALTAYSNNPVTAFGTILSAQWSILAISLTPYTGPTTIAYVGGGRNILRPPAGQSLLGAYPGSGNADPQTFEAQICGGQMLDIVSRYEALDGTWPTTDDQSLVAAGRNIYYAMGTRLQAGGDALLSDIANGVYDTTLVARAKNLAALGWPMLLAFAHEFDGNTGQNESCPSQTFTISGVTGSSGSGTGTLNQVSGTPPSGTSYPATPAVYPAAGATVNWTDSTSGSTGTLVAVNGSSSVSSITVTSGSMPSNGNTLKLWNQVSGTGADNMCGYFVPAWQHIWNIFNENGANANVAWCWVMTSSNLNAQTAALFPGTGYVDWLGADPYDPTLSKGSPHATYNPWVSWVTSQSFYTGQPLGIFETGVEPNNDAGGAAWINLVPAELVADNIQLWTWFNANGTWDTIITPGSQMAAAYASVAASSTLNPAPSSGTGPGAKAVAPQTVPVVTATPTAAGASATAPNPSVSLAGASVTALPQAAAATAIALQPIANVGSGLSQFDAWALSLTATGSVAWLLEDPLGTTLAADSSGNGHPLTITGAFAFGASSIVPTDTNSCAAIGSGGEGTCNYLPVFPAVSYVAILDFSTIPIAAVAFLNNASSTSGADLRITVNGTPAFVCGNGVKQVTVTAPTSLIAGHSYYISGNWDGVSTVTLYVEDLFTGISEQVTAALAAGSNGFSPTNQFVVAKGGMVGNCGRILILPFALTPAQNAAGAAAAGTIVATDVTGSGATASATAPVLAITAVDQTGSSATATAPNTSSTPATVANPSAASAIATGVAPTPTLRALDQTGSSSTATAPQPTATGNLSATATPTPAAATATASQPMAGVAPILSAATATGSALATASEIIVAATSGASATAPQSAASIGATDPTGSSATAASSQHVVVIGTPAGASATATAAPPTPNPAGAPLPAIAVATAAQPSGTGAGVTTATPSAASATGTAAGSTIAGAGVPAPAAATATGAPPVPTEIVASVAAASASVQAPSTASDIIVAATSGATATAAQPVIDGTAGAQGAAATGTSPSVTPNPTGTPPAAAGTATAPQPGVTASNGVTALPSAASAPASAPAVVPYVVATPSAAGASAAAGQPSMTLSAPVGAASVAATAPNATPSPQGTPGAATATVTVPAQVGAVGAAPSSSHATGTAPNAIGSLSAAAGSCSVTVTAGLPLVTFGAAKATAIVWTRPAAVLTTTISPGDS